MISAVIKPASNRKRVESILLVALFLCTGGVVMGQGSTNLTFTVNQAIPDGNPSGLANTQTVNVTSIPNFSFISDLSVTLNISGGFNGDYYAYLVNNTGGFAVLLNRVGKTASNPVGYSDGGFSITLSDSSPNNIHTYQNVSNPGGGVLAGTWAPDGRNVDPSVVLDTSPVSATLGSFAGTNPNGQWILFLADLDYGEQGTLTTWTLNVTAVPEPSSIQLALVGLGVCFGLNRWARRRV
jgi:subtilisin-like proprotein convertase family protein